uniref:Uncharacterized protein n=1 Tax=Anguilla anguilla TaxID=7936 RepID=A0A0E9W2N8_ANGAN
MACPHLCDIIVLRVSIHLYQWL